MIDVLKVLIMPSTCIGTLHQMLLYVAALSEGNPAVIVLESINQL